MIDYELSRHLDHPPERVMAALSDLDARAAWRPDLRSVERLAGDGFGPGTRWRETRDLFGAEATEVVEVAELDAPRRLVLQVDGEAGTARRGTYVFTWTLTPRDGGTTLTLRGEGSGLGTAGRVVGRFLQEPFERASRRELDALARHLDGSARPGS